MPHNLPEVSLERLQEASQRTYRCDFNQGLRQATGINADANDITQALWFRDLAACPIELLGDGTPGNGGLLNSHALLLPGTTGAFISTPDVAALDIIGDIDIRVEGINIGGGTNQAVVSKHNPTGNQRSYELNLILGLFRLAWSVDGTAELTSPITPQHFMNSHTAIRVTMDVVNGANRVVDRYGGTFGTGTLLQSDTTAGNTSIFASTAALCIGARPDGTNPFSGRITRVEVRDGIGGTVVANPDFRSLATGTTSFADGTGKTWTIQGAARIV